MQRPGKPFPGLPASIAIVRVAHPDRADLQSLAWELCPRLPGKPRTSANLKEEGACSRLNPLEQVIVSDPWLAMNTENAVNVVWAESDVPGLSARVAACRAAGVPIRWCVYGKNDTGHVGIPLAVPVVTGIRTSEADRAMLRKLSLAVSYLITGIDGDRSAGLRGMTKSPFHPRWTTVVYDAQPATLDEILIPLQTMAEAEGWEAPRRRYKGDRKREPSPEGRNCALFDLTRWWAGDEFVRDGSAILAKALEINSSFAIPLGYGEAASVARSITKFMINRYDGRGRQMPLPPEEVKARQKAGRQAWAERQRSDRSVRLVEAVQRIRSQGGEAGQQAVAEEAGVSLRTVQSAWSEVFRFVNNTQPAVPLSGSSISHTHEDAVPPPPDSEIPVWQNDKHHRRAEEAARHSNLVAFERLVFLKRNRTAALAAREVYADDAARAELKKSLADVVRIMTRVEKSAAREEGEQPDPWSPGEVKRRQRLASVRRCAEREASHELAAGQGLRGYRDWVAARYAALFRERKADIERAEEWPEPDADVDPVAVWAAREQMAERLHITRMGWSSKMKAETRISRRWDDELQARERQQPRPRLRTTLDAMDRVALLTIHSPPVPCFLNEQRRA